MARDNAGDGIRINGVYEGERPTWEFETMLEEHQIGFHHGGKFVLGTFVAKLLEDFTGEFPMEDDASLYAMLSDYENAPSWFQTWFDDTYATPDFANSAGEQTQKHIIYRIIARDQSLVLDDYSNGNVIGNNDNGIHVSDAAGVSILGNVIGADVTGDAAGNAYAGILIADSTLTFVGGTLQAELSGSPPEYLGPLPLGFTEESGNVVVASGGWGIHVTGGGNLATFISGNWVGVHRDYAHNSMASLGNGDGGILVDDGAVTTIIGSSPEGTPFDLGGGNVYPLGNTISANDGPGIQWLNIVTGVEEFNAAAGNDIGLDKDGALAGNAGDGILVEDSVGILIGGYVLPDDPDTIHTHNTIVGNGGNGVRVTGDAGENNVVVGNYIGTNVAEDSGLGNALAGILFYDSDDNIALLNVIAENDYGIVVNENAIDNVLSKNSIFDNVGVGILLANGGNALRSPLVVSAATLSGDDLTLTLDWADAGSANFPVTIELFLADSQTSGEGKVYLGDKSDSSNTYPKNLTFYDLVGLAVDDWIVLTITDADGNTSSFSVSFQVS